MPISSSNKKLKYLGFGSDTDIILAKSNIENLPAEIKSSKQFCFWKYQVCQDNKKLIKVPYTLIAGRGIVPGLKRESLFWSFEFMVNRQNRGWPYDQQPGLYLKNSGLSVIDIDSYQKHPRLEKLIYSMLSKGCYVEVSPSGQGLHIFYRGRIDWSHGRKKGCSSIYLSNNQDGQDIKTKCELYDHNDSCFITLTGRRLLNRHDNREFDALPSAFDIQEELEEFRLLFFVSQDNQVSQDELQTNDAPILSDSSSQPNLSELLVELSKRIQNSRFKKKFDMLSRFDNPEDYSYESVSEADMAFVGLAVMFLDQPLDISQQFLLLYMFFERYRPKRPKTSNCTEYVPRIIQTALDNRNKYATKRKGSIKKEVMECTAPKSSIIKICNNMKIFHLGRSIKDFTYSSKKDGNCLEASAPVSLNQTDFRYFMQLLFMYVESTQPSVDRLRSLDDLDQVGRELCPINPRAIFKNLGLTPGGRTYKDFFESLKKLSNVNLEYDKVTGKDKEKRFMYGGGLLEYKFDYTNEEKSNQHHLYRKFCIRMHPIILHTVYKSSFNYSLLNIESYNRLPSDKMRLLYYHFCQTIRPKETFAFFAEDLLRLWPPSNSRHTKGVRLKELSNLVKRFQEIQDTILDLTFYPVFDQETLVLLKVTKNHMRLT